LPGGNHGDTWHFITAVAPDLVRGPSSARSNWAKPMRWPGACRAQSVLMVTHVAMRRPKSSMVGPAPAGIQWLRI